MDIDLNCDLGEGAGNDAELLNLVTSANISCGFHAGGPDIAAAALRLAAERGVTAGAHPGYDDREHFGRRELDLSAEATAGLCAYQIGALSGLADHLGVTLRYIKPHGGLYNQACRDDRIAQPIVDVAAKLGLPLMGLPGSKLEAACRGRCEFVAEGFADRRYLPNGTLVPRSRPDAMIHDPAEAVEQAEQLIRERGVRTLCVHGDNPEAIAFVLNLREVLTRRGFRLRAFA
ncbi:MAG: 5-oxoprolinase subunit PxpA [Gemmataceae bacterium]